jgi:hypothetical protein
MQAAPAPLGSETQSSQSLRGIFEAPDYRRTIVSRASTHRSSMEGACVDVATVSRLLPG